MKVSLAVTKGRIRLGAAPFWTRWLIFVSRWVALIWLGRVASHALAGAGDTGTSSSPSAPLRAWIREGEQAGG